MEFIFKIAAGVALGLLAVLALLHWRGWLLARWRSLALAAAAIAALALAPIAYDMVNKELRKARLREAADRRWHCEQTAEFKAWSAAKRQAALSFINGRLSPSAAREAAPNPCTIWRGR